MFLKSLYFTALLAFSLALLVAAEAQAGPPAKSGKDGLLEITDTNVKGMKTGKRMPKDTQLKLSGAEWVKYSDTTTGSAHTCVGKYEGPISSCPAPKPCGLVNIIADECGKNGVALP